ncbi:RHS repeat domain-containing protein [Chryseobacterium viscerum]|uniref:RHS repeat domain-containing protein n=1 Tax=Chryseobacterium viscerum TaxID=1037377 RepID=UPI002222DA27|nr:RHS repeat domain-containing protein [Chryseobacterium viscerum]MCW1961288.1 RHS repeat protein [Chryseobacterium viscerum]
MKTLYKLLPLSILIFGLGKGQRNFGDTPEPVPSVSSFSSYVNTPVSLSTGVPNISIPLFSLPTINSQLGMSTGLSYHVANASGNKPGSEVGIGWSLGSGGSISRVVNSEVDEFYDNASKPDYKKNQFDDVYYYNIPGNSGKFTFIRDLTNNTFTLNHISGNNIKIEYTRDSNTATLVLTSFKITDEKGFKYIFEDYSKSLNGTNFYFKSAFFLTKILDESNIEVANFAYQKDNINKPGSTTLLYQSCKLKEISTDFGKLGFENIYEPLKEKGYDDPYKINSVSLFDKYNRLISKYKLFYSNGTKRELNSLEKLNNNQESIEKRSFEYDNFSFVEYQDIGNNDYACNSYTKTEHTYRALKKMLHPEGGYTMYNFQFNEVYKDNSSLQLNNTSLANPYLQSLNETKRIFFDTNQSSTYNLHVDTATTFYIGYSVDEIYEDKYPMHVLPVINIKLKKSGVEILPTTTTCSKYNLAPGDYTFEIKGQGNNAGFGYGNIVLSTITTASLPFRNAMQVKTGVRIASIQHFDSNNVLKKTTQYEYNSFLNPNDSSGAYYTSENCDGNSEFYDNGIVLYKNVKEIYGDTGNNLGYTNYSFKMPGDFTSTIPSFRPYYNITSTGLLYKQDVYNQQNVMTSSQNTEYVMEDISGAPQYFTCSGYNSKAAWIKSAKVISTTFFDNASSLVNSTETSYSPYNFAPSIVKETSPEGIITEKTIKYASDVANTKLMNARMLATPLQTETKVDGQLAAKSETKFDNPANLYPSSIVSYDLKSLAPITESIITNYDGKGNPREVIAKSGIPTAIIYGYNGTQVIAKITGASYNQISSLATVTAAVAASDADASNPVNEPALLTALENVRKDPAMKEYSITTYTYDPLIGTTSVTSPNGIRTVYRYDNFNRLQRLEDKDGNILKDYEYNYKH